MPSFCTLAIEGRLTIKVQRVRVPTGLVPGGVPVRRPGLPRAARVGGACHCPAEGAPTRVRRQEVAIAIGIDLMVGGPVLYFSAAK
jgi:hypothetical protein